MPPSGEVRSIGGLCETPGLCVASSPRRDKLSDDLTSIKRHGHRKLLPHRTTHSATAYP